MEKSRLNLPGEDAHADPLPPELRIIFIAFDTLFQDYAGDTYIYEYERVSRCFFSFLSFHFTHSFVTVSFFKLASLSFLLTFHVSFDITLVLLAFID